MADEGYDPRFDPAFQRGFEGEAAFPPRQVPANHVPSRQAAIPAPDRMVAPIPDRLRARPQSAPSSHLSDEDFRPPAQRTLVDPVDRFERLEREPVPLRSNPFLIAVLVIAIALIGAGVLIGSRIDLWYDDVSPDGPGFGLLNMLQFGAPLAIILGVATVIAVLVILALRWRGRPED
jgi:hypothetical protein